MTAAKMPPSDPAQAAVDEVVSTWPDVKPKQVFGHRGYIRGGKMFAFLGDTGVAVKTTTAEEADALYATDGVVPFVYSGSMEMRAWPVLPLRSDRELAEALSAVRRSYEASR